MHACIHMYDEYVNVHALHKLSFSLPIIIVTIASYTFLLVYIHIFFNVDLYILVHE